MNSAENIWNDENLMEVLESNGVVVMPTDTLYGIVGKATNPSTVNRIYDIRKRNRNKPCIVLIGSLSELEKFSVNLSEAQKNALKDHWPGPVSFVFDCNDDSLNYLHCGTQTLAFRLPVPVTLRELLLKVGPLVAPSANIEASPPAQSISMAKEYFGDLVDLYMDAGELQGYSSKVIKLHKDGSTTILRE